MTVADLLNNRPAIINKVIKNRLTAPKYCCDVFNFSILKPIRL